MPTPRPRRSRPALEMLSDTAKALFQQAVNILWDKAVDMAREELITEYFESDDWVRTARRLDAIHVRRTTPLSRVQEPLPPLLPEDTLQVPVPTPLLTLPADEVRAGTKHLVQCPICQPGLFLRATVGAALADLKMHIHTSHPGVAGLGKEKVNDLLNVARAGRKL